jgi:anti-anti-sigma factor
MEITNGIAKIHLSGELDGTSANDFKAIIDKAATQAPKNLVLLMSELTFMASAGLRVLIFARQKMEKSVEIYLIAPQDKVRETLEMTGFHYSVTILEQYDVTQIENS